MINSSEVNYPLSMPFECIHSPETENAYPVSADGFYDAKLLFLRKGELTVSLDGNKTNLQAEDLMVIFPDTAFTLTPAKAEDLPEFGVIRLDPCQMEMPEYMAGLRTVFQEARQQHMPMRISPKDAGKWQVPALAEACFRECESTCFGWETAVQARLNQICIELIRFWREKGLKISTAVADEDPICSVTDYIQRHIQDGIRVEELAGRCNLSYPWFAKKFREIFGVSCKEYIERVRVVRVEQYLRYTDLDLTEISEVTGYADCSHMIKNFKRLRNTTPGQYRISRKA